jgi:PTS system nitrogen regulatory IIA component
MSLVSSLLPLANVVLDVDVSSKQHVFEEVGRLFEQNQKLSHTTVINSLADREKLGSTSLGQGIAIPHGRIKGLRQAVGAFLRLKTPIPFDAPDDRPVNLLFILLVPEQATDLHLQILGELAQLFSNKSFRERLASAQDPAQLHQLFAG